VVGALVLGFVCGVIARVLMPGDVFRNWGGLVGAIIGTLIVLGLTGYFLRRRQPGPTPSTRPLGDDGPRPVS
jgi:uncharacterized membrane protein YeaQ/YmgE (transglycosylase-associated protein family)